MQIADGYNYLSKMNILHRDLKPSNIFRKGDMWKIGDFGFSVVCNQEYLVDKINVGTPLYMPP
jgi:serine/threonine protein kinase